MPLPVIEWAVAERPVAGETESGDIHLAAFFDGGALVGAIDGLGHGPEAARVARAGAAALSADPGRPIQALVEACHETLRGTRGVVLSLASIDAPREQMTWVGVGNVEAVLYRDRPGENPAYERIVSRSGVIGYQIPRLRAISLAIQPADVLVFATDGVEHGFADVPPFHAPVQAHADHLLKAYGKSSDDALVLVVRYLGAAA
jgi:negative regulator of sigma-B (phosphoserine phosphatase)